MILNFLMVLLQVKSHGYGGAGFFTEKSWLVIPRMRKFCWISISSEKMNATGINYQPTPDEKNQNNILPSSSAS
jgi:hypothetical protein